MVVLRRAVRFFLLFAGIALINIAPTRAQDTDSGLLHEVTSQTIPLVSAPGSSSSSSAIVQQRSEPVRHTFNGVVVKLHTSAADLDGHIRFRATDLGAKWSGWKRMQLFPIAPKEGLHMATYRTSTYRRNVYVEVRFEAAPSDTITIDGAGSFNNRTDTDHQVIQPVPRQEAYQPTPSSHIDAPSLVRRSEWEARPFACSSPQPHPHYSQLTLHHTAGAYIASYEGGIQRMQAIQDFHIDGRGWCDIGYQFVADNAGNLYQGRPFIDESKALEDGPQLAIGAHVGGHNTGNIGLSLMGCYHPPAGSDCRDEITSDGYETVVQMFAYLADTYGVDPQNILGHRDFGGTACPGDNNYQLLDDIRRDVREALAEEPIVQFASFSGQLSSGSRSNVQLAWTTTDENNVDHYRVERWQSDHFAEAGQVNAKGGQEISYTFSDQVTSCDSSLTYRVVAVSPDDLERDTEAITIQRPSIGTGTLSATSREDGVFTLQGTLTEKKHVASYALVRLTSNRSDTLAVRSSGSQLSFTDRQTQTPGPTTYQLVAQDQNGCEAVLDEEQFDLQQPSSYVLAEAFPNPARTSATLRYFVKEDQKRVHLAIYDAAGQHVATLVNGAGKAGGQWHTAHFDVTSLASGTYYARMRVDGFSGPVFHASTSIVVL